MSENQRNPDPFVWETPESKALTVKARWERQYAGWSSHLYKVDSLPDEPTPAEVAEVIGNWSWTQTCCDHCGADDVPVVILGEAEDYESSTARVCADCLKEALRGAP